MQITMKIDSIYPFEQAAAAHTPTWPMANSLAKLSYKSRKIKEAL
jgi:hypothetical protein